MAGHFNSSQTARQGVEISLIGSRKDYSEIARPIFDKGDIGNRGVSWLDVAVLTGEVLRIQ